MGRKKGSCSDPVRLYTEPRAWGLPSLGGASLSAHALLRFLEMPYASARGVSAFMTPNKTLPVAVFDAGEDEKVVAGITEIVDAIDKDTSAPNPFGAATKFMKAEAQAFIALVQSDIEPAIVYERWVDDANYEDFAAELRKSPDHKGIFPMDRLEMYMARRRYIGMLGREDGPRIYKKAERALRALSVRLGEGKKYFYGEKPSALDSVVFGYLAPSLYAPLPRAKLRGLVASCANIVKLCEGIRKDYFATEDEDLFELDLEEIDRERRRISEEEAKTSATKNSKSKTESAEDEERRRKNRYFLAACAAVFGAFILLGAETEVEIPLSED